MGSYGPWEDGKVVKPQAKDCKDPESGWKPGIRPGLLEKPLFAPERVGGETTSDLAGGLSHKKKQTTAGLEWLSAGGITGSEPVMPHLATRGFSGQESHAYMDIHSNKETISVVCLHIETEHLQSRQSSRSFHVRQKPSS